MMGAGGNQITFDQYSPGPADWSARYRLWRGTDAGDKTFRLFERFALEAAATGRPFGIGLIAERVRWEAFVATTDQNDYKVNNNYRAYIARDLIRRHPHLGELISTRVTRKEKTGG